MLFGKIAALFAELVDYEAHVLHAVLTRLDVLRVPTARGRTFVVTCNVTDKKIYPVVLQYYSLILTTRNWHHFTR